VIWTHAAAAVAALAVGFTAGWQVQSWRWDRAEARQQAHVATLRETAMHQALIETTRRLTAQQEAANAAAQQARRARADAAAADAAAGSLREHVARLAARAAGNDPAAAAGGQTAADAAGMLAELQRRADERAGILARIADERGIAGAACERAYDALSR
jgi:hypothetical protein